VLHGVDGKGKEAPTTSLRPSAQLPNVVSVSPEVVQDNRDDSVVYNFVIQHCLFREETDYYLRQPNASGTFRTLHSLQSMVESSINLETKIVH